MNFTLEKDLNVLVMCWYYNRPDLIIHAVNSVRNQTYKNWKLVIIDDCSDIPLEPIVNNLISEEESNKIFLYQTNDSKEEKNLRGG
jgi:glycosyltransferase involved in cell wall biosynthesis